METMPIRSAHTTSGIEVFDFFCGCGGLSLGLAQAGMKPIFALDKDMDSVSTFDANFSAKHDVRTVARAIEKFPPDDLRNDVESARCNGSRLLFAACAPCQPFTKQNIRQAGEEETSPRETDSRFPLLEHIRAFISGYKPDYVFVENVPGLLKERPDGPLGKLEKCLEENGYPTPASEIIAAQDYGVPQRRRRFVMLASRLGEIDLPKPTHGPNREHPYKTVRDAIGDKEQYPPLKAGETHPEIPNHQAARLSERNLRRLWYTPDEGTRRSWPEYLQLPCYKKEYTGHTDVYGRMRWDAPATGLTTRCISLSNGRFGHPEQHRAISVREAAALQTFPDDFVFTGSLNAQARQIGNAVPPLLAKVFGEHILEHYRTHRERTRNEEQKT
uniref:DNA (cytosine-5-)-methyltransferase n=1 Tax=Candidatus Kentrum eta TaxID=2126337 RepID=A0A450UD00_9GAMM|nr:MAG: DNA (cytosine-5)-methyltransferase 1 [Candidatus Kentron sp. H]VFJ90237.1 MAG: DNA (cytosine-5)-methyltransferase 1 [Candidatus Kentron sp. H]VFJ96592.1 MAG: DNA (cytosine-5)-methyltransferase 1 [Candidatus Kentron sp. H]